MKKPVMVAAVIAIFFLSGWGFLIHRTTTQMSVYELPRPMRSFFQENINYLVKNSVRPDQRRNDDSTEAPKHIIDLELYGDSAAWKMPYRFEDALKVIPFDTLKKHGYVPYWVVEMKKRLTKAFESRNKDSILFY